MNDEQGNLFEIDGPTDGSIRISDRCVMRSQGEDRLLIASGIPLVHFAGDDAMARAHAMVMLVDQGWATQVEVAKAFGCDTRTVRRLQQRFDSGGLAALGRPGGYPAGRGRCAPHRIRVIERLRSEGRSLREIAGRLGITEKAVRKALKRLGWKPAPPAELPLGAGEPTPSPSSPGDTSGADPNLSGSAAEPASAPSVPPLPVTQDTDPADRRMDRILAFLGALDDAAPLFRPGARVPRAGVLLAVPAIVATGVLDCAREIYGSIGPAFYGLRTSVVAFVLMALLRIKRPEGVKEHSPEDLGRLLGLDRAPEVKTLRRKLARLSGLGRAAQLGRALAERRVKTHGHAMGFLYLDGHVRVYHGQHEIPYAHVARMRLARPATTDYWVNDASGEPLFLVTAPANAGLVKMLPPLLRQIRELVGERRVTVVFDRGGWSPELFEQILRMGFDILTYRKGALRRIARRRFRKRRATIDGRTIRYTLADTNVHLLGGRLRLRQVTRLMESGHQTPILTSRRDLPDVQVAYRMFERWRQENFFKYLREEYALDALLEHAVEADDATRDVPNPKRRALAAQVRAARAEVEQLCARYGLEALDNPERRRRTMRGFKIANAKGGRAVNAAFERLDRLVARRARMPKRVPVRDVVQGDVVRLAPERQHLGSILKMVAYHAESDLVRQVRPHYPRAEQEGRTLVKTALTSAADIEVAKDELRVTLAPLSSPHRSRAIAALCRELDASPVCFPGTALRMRFAVAPEA